MWVYQVLNNSLCLSTLHTRSRACSVSEYSITQKQHDQTLKTVWFYTTGESTPRSQRLGRSGTPSLLDLGLGSSSCHGGDRGEGGGGGLLELQLMELQGLSAACHPPSFLKGQLRVQGLGSLRGGHSHARPLPAPSQLDELSRRDCCGPTPARLAHGQGGQRRHLLTG